MDKLWGGQVAEVAEALNASISFDKRLWRQDIRGSLAHAEMLGKQGIIPREAAEAITAALENIREELEQGRLSIDPGAEDIHTFIELELTRRLGDIGKMLHTGRSRNDQVATDLRLYLRDEGQGLMDLLKELILIIARRAGEYTDTVMPGYTHLQRAQPVTFGHHLCAYGMMFLRDRDRLKDALERMNECPLGAGALAGTTLPLDRDFTARKLGFARPMLNSLDAVSDRDYCVELAAAMSLMALHLSRLGEELVLWSSLEFGFINMPEGFVTGSSIMPQKKNPDMAELLRGKAGRVFSSLTTLLTMLKGLPLSYNKDLQEDKEAIFDALDTSGLCLRVAAALLEGITANAERMRQAAGAGFINATDCADYLVRKGIPFREAYRITARLVAGGIPLEDLPLQDYQSASPAFEEDIYEVVDLLQCVRRRQLPLAEEIAWLKEEAEA